ncbi:hypothetical protein CTAYLR_003001 [Chrysophaeum taylorii]|uniref:Uncharacterized protein n=1 Tax=Chrysophaeum taylorii TaxID=2483200 RepID=A0AAD7XHH3_9STRA|nr:hypothetical protein CTAYLR_003001 [Chrysophaeum taylorii]
MWVVVVGLSVLAAIINIAQFEARPAVLRETGLLRDEAEQFANVAREAALGAAKATQIVVVQDEEDGSSNEKKKCMPKQMRYWKARNRFDERAEAEGRVPAVDPDRFPTFVPDLGGWNNARLSFETALVLARASGRRLVLPPRQTFYLMTACKCTPTHRTEDSCYRLYEFLDNSFETFVPDAWRQRARTVVDGDRVFGAEGVRVVHSRSSGAATRRADELRAGASKDAGKPLEPAHLGRLLCPWYAYVLHVDQAASNYYERMVRNLVRFDDRVARAAGDAVSVLGRYSSVHARRNEFQYRERDPRRAIEGLKRALDAVLEASESVYLATDETNASFFDGRVPGVALEKDRLRKRTGLEGKMYRENAPLTSQGLIVPEPNAAGFLSDADRFHTDVSGEEYSKRMAKYESRQQSYANKRVERAKREEERWESIEQSKVREESYWAQQRENGEKARKNHSSVPYDAINLTYADDLHGEELRFRDDKVRYRAAVRSRHLQLCGDTRAGYNIINGTNHPTLGMPPEPAPAEPLARHIDAMDAASAAERAVEYNNMIKRR